MREAPLPDYTRSLAARGSAPRVANVAIDEGEVVEVSANPIEDVDAERIDAGGQWVMPGFIDTHTHYDAEILAAPGLLERLPLGPNVMAFAGHSDMRVRVMGLGRSVDPKIRPTGDEQREMEGLLEDALDAGFLGMSSMTNPWDKVGGDRYRSARLPSTYASWGEYRKFHKILRNRGRILQSAPNITTKAQRLVVHGDERFAWTAQETQDHADHRRRCKSSPYLVRAITAATSAVNRLLGGELRWQSVPMPFEVYADGIDLVVFEEFGAGKAALHLADEIERNELLKDTAYRRGFRRDYKKKWRPRMWHRDFHDAWFIAPPNRSCRLRKPCGNLPANLQTGMGSMLARSRSVDVPTSRLSTPLGSMTRSTRMPRRQ